MAHRSTTLISALKSVYRIRIGRASLTQCRPFFSNHHAIPIRNFCSKSVDIAPKSDSLDSVLHNAENSLKTASLVIFDKDGTLICFHSMWVPWALNTAERIEEASNLKTVDITKEVYRLLGFCPIEQKVRPGLLAEATMGVIRQKLVQLLVEHGVDQVEAEKVVAASVDDCDTSSTDTLKQIYNLRHLFEQLKSHNIKIAVCTADSRVGTENALKSLQLDDYIDIVVCGDDRDAQPKPSPHNALAICKALDVDPADTFMVGDTLADMGMGRSANLGGTIGVLSGVSLASELEPHADHVVSHVGELMSIVLNRRKKAPDVCSSPEFRHDCQQLRPKSGVRQSRSFHSSSVRPFIEGDNYRKGLFPDLGGRKPTHIIVGGGSAGCVLANRLTENPDNRVLLIEAGPRDHWWNWKIHMPAALMYNLCDNKYNWFYHTTAQEHMNDRVFYWPRGRVWGGSSSLNAMVYIRGHPYDYDRWQNEGAANWDFKNCLPYFKKAQNHELASNDNDPFRGNTGPLRVTRGKCENPLHKAFIEAGEQIGLGTTEDMNGYRQEGTGPMDMTIGDGRRWSASRAYLWPSHDIPLVQHMPGVGANLQDHLEIYVQQKCTQPITLYDRSSWKFPHNMIKIGLEWFVSQTGDGASTHLESGGFARSSPQVAHPDMQFHFLPSTVHDDGRKSGFCHAYQVHVGTMRPESRGSVRLQHRDPRRHPLMNPNYLATDRDRAEFRDCIRFSRELFAQKAFDPFRGEELAPGSECRSDWQLDEFVRLNAASAYHPSCTCKMGPVSDSNSVVDPETMKVHGFDNLMIVDASVMPSIVSGNLNAPTIMLAEKAADLIQRKTPRPIENPDIWKPAAEKTA